jgi:hypothetical protein
MLPVRSETRNKYSHPEYLFLNSGSLAFPPKPWTPLFILPRRFGGGERDRTDDPLLAKQVLSQLSYTPSSQSIKDRMSSAFVLLPRIWWVWMDLNHRPHAYQACALTN